MCHSFHTSKMTGTYQEQLVLLFSIELNLILYVVILTHTTNIPGYRNFTRTEPAYFDLIEERITPHLRKSITNFRKPLEVRLKLAVTLRHLSTGESYTSLQYHWRVGRTTICKFVPQVCKAILKEFQQGYLVCPTDPED